MTLIQFTRKVHLMLSFCPKEQCNFIVLSKTELFYCETLRFISWPFGSECVENWCQSIQSRKTLEAVSILILLLDSPHRNYSTTAFGSRLLFEAITTKTGVTEGEQLNLEC